MNRRGFAYLVAVLILGLLAFMGIFLMQSSSAEYSQSAVSVYRTMARQLAEAAAEEAFVMLEERFKDKSENGPFQLLLHQAASSEVPKNGGVTGLNPTLLGDFNDMKDKVTQALTLKDYHMTRAGFEIEKILPSIKDCRPIDQGPLNNEKCFYRSPDRLNGFDNNYSRDWYLTLQLDVTVALQKRRKLKIDYTISRDIKVINLGPMARNFSLFSILTHNINTTDPATLQGKLIREMNTPDTNGGRLILWNQPFQSRVYLHGPTIIGLENPELGLDRPSNGAYNLNGSPEDSKPGTNHAFQYADTFYGFSYYPTIGRAIFPPESTLRSLGMIFGLSEPKPDMSDSADMSQHYPGIAAHATVKGGFLPTPDPSFWQTLRTIDANGIQDTYFRGTNIFQKFLPAGPFCRTPWKYVSPMFDGEDRYLPNSTADYSEAMQSKFPEDDEYLKIEHRWLKDNPDMAKSTAIRAGLYEMKLNNVTSNVTSRLMNEQEFSLSYYNDPDPETFLGRFGGLFANLGSRLWTRLTIPFEAVAVVASPLITRIFGGPEDTYIEASAEDNFENLFPPNFRWNMRSIVTRRLKDQDEIPRDSEGRWILNGVYWLDSFQVNMPVTYVGTGTLLITLFNPAKPAEISGSILSLKGPDNFTPLGHLNIIYNPFKQSISEAEAQERMLAIKGAPITVEASVFSCYGIKTNDGNITNLAEIGMNPSQTMTQWVANGFSLNNLSSKTNIIMGNYVNFFMNKDKQLGDLWVIHNINSSLYFDRTSDGKFEIAQKAIDASPAGRNAYEKKVHEFFMSPKIQHVSTIGGSDD